MKKISLLFILLFSAQLFLSQTYQWQWAKTGGAFNGINSVGFNQISDEHILDIAVDNQNNTYYLSSLFNTTPLLDGQPVTNYGGRNLIIFSTDCQGNVRWTRTIGGSGNTGGLAQKIVLDNNGGLYVSAFMPNNATPGSGNLPPRFGDSDIQPMVSNNPTEPQQALQQGFLLKYNTSNGQLFWRKAFQGDVTFFNNNMDVSSPLIDSQNNLHIILGFQYGTHLNGQITVPSSFNSAQNYQYYLVKYDLSGNILGTPALLPIQGYTNFTSGYLNFIYDEVNSRYYLGGTSPTNTGSTAAFSYNNIGINESAFVLAFNSTTFAELWRKEIDNGFAQPSDNIFGLKKDPVTSDIYVSGLYSEGAPTPATFGSYTFSTPLSGRISFVAKLNNSGTVLWCTNPVALSDGSTQVAVENARMPITIKGNEVLFAKGSIRETWGNFPMVRPLNERTDPLVVKFNKTTGVVTGTHEVLGSGASEEHFTAIATDNDGNIMLGGFINGQLFTDPNDGVPTISNVAAATKSNFFFAKLANVACSTMSVEETALEAGLQFYPNPVQDYLSIKSKNKIENYEVYSSAGQTVLRGSLGNTNAQINMSALTAGVYYVKVKTEKAVVTEKVVKK